MGSGRGVAARAWIVSSPGSADAFGITVVFFGALGTYLLVAGAPG